METIKKDDLLKPLFSMMADSFKMLCSPNGMDKFKRITIENQMETVLTVADYFFKMEVINSEEHDKLCFMSQDIARRSNGMEVK